MKYINQKFIPARTEAFTFSDTLIFLAIASILLSVVLSFTKNVLVRENISISQNTAADFSFRFERNLRKEIKAIQIPYWSEDFYCYKELNKICFNYYKGSKKIKKFCFPEEVVLLNCKILFTDENIPYGLELKYDFDSETYVIKQCFSSIPVFAK